MKSHPLPFVLFSLFVCGSLPGADGPVAAPLVVTHAVLWTEQGALSDREIVVRDGRVAAVGASGSLVRPADARVIDAAGDTLLPGLIDAHVHLSSPARLPADFAANPREHIYAVAGKQLLRSGVTAGRIHLWDLPAATAFKADSARAHFPAPRLALAGPALFGGRPNWDNPNGNVWGVKSVDDAVAKVRRLHEAGMEWIALHDLARFAAGELEAIVAEARRTGLRLLLAGDRLDSLEHGVGLDVDSIDYLDFSDTPAYPDELLAKLKARDRAVTLVPMPGNRERFRLFRAGQMSLDEPHLVEFLPPAVAEFALKALGEERLRQTDSTKRFDAATPSLPGKFRQLRATGLPMAIGTDCGSPAHFHADAIWWEMETWRQLGVPVDEIVRAATILPAALLGQADIGHLRAGARADFVLYRGGIAEGPLSVKRVRTVAKGGIVFVDEGEPRALMP